MPINQQPWNGRIYPTYLLHFVFTTCVSFFGHRQAFWLLIEEIYTASMESEGVKTLDDSGRSVNIVAPPLMARDTISTPSKHRSRRNAVPMIFLPDSNRVTSTGVDAELRRSEQRRLSLSSAGRRGSRTSLKHVGSFNLTNRVNSARRVSAKQIHTVDGGSGYKIVLD